MLKWTGERFLPWRDDPVLAYEHLHRYMFATQFVAGKNVLDLACGEGYGANILAESAAKVLALDIAPDVIEHARTRYAANNLEFIVGSITNVPIIDGGGFDVAVCFEAIEHISDHDGLLGEIKRLLKPSGLLIVSTPNKPVYDAANPHPNAFHVRELEFDEFKKLIENHFHHVRFFGQRIYANSNIWDLSPRTAAALDQFVIQRGMTGFERVPPEARQPVYYVAVASNIPVAEEVRPSLLVDEGNALLAEKDAALDVYRNSISWQITAPLRRIADAVGFKKGPSDSLEIRPETPESDDHETIDALKTLYSSMCEVNLKAFLASEDTLELPHCEEPVASIIVVLFNRAELTLQCLRSIRDNARNDVEVIIVDNASSDETALLLARVQGHHLISNTRNLGFAAAVNAAVHRAGGKHLVLLNNDAQLLPGSLRAAIRTLENEAAVGVVGGRVVRLDGKLQEAGSIVWRDGSCLGYGRGEDPFAPNFMFRRDVDYCSAVFMLTPRDLWLELDGFDNSFTPAYYEDTDYCLRVWQHGLRVVYEPAAVVIHYEFASSDSRRAATALQSSHRDLFKRRHAAMLARQPEQKTESVLIARIHDTSPAHRQLRVLVMDDKVPHSWRGSGFPRSRTLLLTLRKLGYFITFFPMAGPEKASSRESALPDVATIARVPRSVLDAEEFEKLRMVALRKWSSLAQPLNEDWNTVYIDLPPEIEVINGWGPARLEQFLKDRRGYYDTIIVSRPHNMSYMRPIVATHPEWFSQTLLIYDAEALYALRDAACLEAKGQHVSRERADKLRRDEISLARVAHRSVAVSEREKELFCSHGLLDVQVLGHGLDAQPGSQGFAGRSGFLFVGPIYDDDSPNGDSMIWFLSEIWPLIHAELGDRATLNIVGVNNSRRIRDLTGPTVQIHGALHDTAELYGKSRVFVAPTRFAAGIPYKIHEAAARGVPVVATGLLADELQWRDGIELHVGSDARDFGRKCLDLHENEERWTRTRDAALAAVRRDCSPIQFENSVREILTPIKVPG